MNIKFGQILTDSVNVVYLITCNLCKKQTICRTNPKSATN